MARGIAKGTGHDARSLLTKPESKMYLVRTDGFTCTREIVEDNRFTFAHPSTQQNLLMWATRPRTVLVLKKKGDALLPELVQAVSFLQHEGMCIMLERDVHETLVRRRGNGSTNTGDGIDMNELQSFDASSASLADAVDLVVCLGGDGLVLHASSLFPYAVPPIACFNLGSMGFLANLQFRDFSQDMKALIEGNSVRHSTISGAYTMKTPAANFVSHSFFVIIL